jgi:hypothetical protein
MDRATWQQVDDRGARGRRHIAENNSRVEDGRKNNTMWPHVGPTSLDLIQTSPIIELENNLLSKHSCFVCRSVSETTLILGSDF